ncbi:MAG: SRPBCC domain-containing protein [Chloroflexi bacterium]|nr:SRPBCC domain-containing protein [Chloroflexota bacterium]
MDARKGGRGAFNFDQRATHASVTVPVVVQRVEPPDVFAFRWLHPDGAEALPGNSLEVEFALTRMGDKTQVRVTESGLLGMEWSDAERATCASEHGSGWRSTCATCANTCTTRRCDRRRRIASRRPCPTMSRSSRVSSTRFARQTRRPSARSSRSWGSPRQVSGYGSKV